MRDMAEEIIITGATGFIGRHLVAELAERGCHMHALSRHPFPPDKLNLTPHTIDLHNHVATATVMNNIKATILIHTAWDTTPGKYWESPINLDWIASSLHLFRNFVKSGGRRIVGIGSCAEYEWNKETYLEKDATHQPATLYGTCKLRLYEIVSKFCQIEGLSFSWARLFFLYGPNEQNGRLLPCLMEHINNNSPLQIRDQNCLRDFLHVSEAARAIASLALSNVEGPVNVCSGTGITVRAFVESVFDAADRPCTVSFDDVKDSPSPRSIVGCNQRLKNELGWQSGREFKELLCETVGSYLK